MQLRNSNNEVIAQFSTITDDSGNAIASQTAEGEIVFNNGAIFKHNQSPKVTTLNGIGLQFQDGEGNSTTLADTTTGADKEIYLPVSTGTLATTEA